MNWYAHLQKAEMIETVGKTMIGKDEAGIASLIAAAGKQGAFKQYAYIAMAEEYLKRLGNYNSMPTIADSIMMSFRENITRYRESTHQLSDKQVEVLARVLHNIFKVLS